PAGEHANVGRQPAYGPPSPTGPRRASDRPASRGGRRARGPGGAPVTRLTAAVAGRTARRRWRAPRAPAPYVSDPKGGPPWRILRPRGRRARVASAAQLSTAPPVRGSARKTRPTPASPP